MKIRVVDSHTGGEPTRIIIEGGPDLGSGDLVTQRECFRNRFDRIRAAVVNEPRGSDAMVGALLCLPQDPASSAGVIFFNNVGYLNMCGHGSIGLIATLAYLGRIQPGTHRIDTPVGAITAELHPNGTVTIGNVPSYRLAKNVAVDVHGYGEVRGDVAWGGNWFFLSEGAPVPLTLDHLEQLTDYTCGIREAIVREGVTGVDGAEIDHIEVFGPPHDGNAHSRNFVLCPGKAYDRSPCGTGTSAKLACLYADGKLKEGEIWRQESIVGSLFEGTVKISNGELRPFITGSAYVNSVADLILDEADPFCWGIGPRPLQ
jgi:4-hydroxyproline epimerase